MDIFLKKHLSQKIIRGEEIEIEAKFQKLTFCHFSEVFRFFSKIAESNNGLITEVLNDVYYKNGVRCRNQNDWAMKRRLDEKNINNYKISVSEELPLQLSNDNYKRQPLLYRDQHRSSFVDADQVRIDFNRIVTYENKYGPKKYTFSIEIEILSRGLTPKNFSTVIKRFQYAIDKINSFHSHEGAMLYKKLFGKTFCGTLPTTIAQEISHPENIYSLKADGVRVNLLFDLSKEMVYEISRTGFCKKIGPFSVNKNADINLPRLKKFVVLDCEKMEDAVTFQCFDLIYFGEDLRGEKIEYMNRWSNASRFINSINSMIHIIAKPIFKSRALAENNMKSLQEIEGIIITRNDLPYSKISRDPHLYKLKNKHTIDLLAIVEDGSLLLYSQSELGLMHYTTIQLNDNNKHFNYWIVECDYSIQKDGFSPFMKTVSPIKIRYDKGMPNFITTIHDVEKTVMRLHSPTQLISDEQINLVCVTELVDFFAKNSEIGYTKIFIKEIYEKNIFFEDPFSATLPTIFDTISALQMNDLNCTFLQENYENGSCFLKFEKKNIFKHQESDIHNNLHPNSPLTECLITTFISV